MAESATMEVRARISADSAQFVKGMESAVKSANSLSGATAGLNKSLFAVGVASSTAAIALIAFGVKSFRAAAEVQELDIALQAIGASSRYGYTELSIAVKAITDAGITAAAARRSVIKLAQSNVDLADASGLATVAQNLSVTASTSAAAALQTLTFAIATAQTRQLRTLGITTQASEAYQIYGRSIGKASKDLTMSEKRQAVLNLILKEGTKVSGAYALAIQSPSKALKEMSDLTNNLQVAVGTRLLNGFKNVILAVFTLYTKFTQAANGTGSFAKALDAMQMLFDKLSAPFVKIATNLGNFIDKIDSSKLSVKSIASAFEKALPAVAAFTAFVGVKTGKRIFQAIPIFQGLFEMLRPGAVAFLVVAATSTQVRDAFTNLVATLEPLLGGFTNLSAVFTEVSSIATGVFAKAIDGVAAIIRTTISFFQENRIALYALQTTLVAVTAAFVAYKAVMIATAIKTTALSTASKIQNFLFNSQVVAIARARVGLASLAAGEAATAVATATATRQTAASTVAIAMKNLVMVKQAAIAGGSAAITKAVTAAEAQLTVASNALSTATTRLATAQGVQAAAAARLTAAEAGLTAARSAAIAPLLITIALIGALVAAFIIAYKNSESFREGFTKAFNEIARITGIVIAFILRTLGQLLIGFGHVMDINHSFGAAVAAVFQFVFDVITAVVIAVIKTFKTLIDGFYNVMKTNDTLRRIITGTFNIISRIIALAVTAVLASLAGLIKGIATVIYGFDNAADFIARSFVAIVGGIAEAGEFIGRTLDRITHGVVSDFLGGLRRGIVAFINTLANVASNIPIIGKDIEGALRRISNSFDENQKKVAEIKVQIKTKELVKEAKDSIDIISSVSNALIYNAKSFGHFEKGVPLALSKVANGMLGFAQNIVNFAAKDLGGNLIEGLLVAAEKVSPILGNMVKGLTSMKEMGKDIGKFLVENTSEAAIKAGNFLVNLAASVESFTQGNVLAKLGDAFGDMISSFKTGLGFGDIAAEEAKKAADLAKKAAADEEAANAIAGSSDLMAKIRDAMAAGIESMRNVLDDLRDAAKSFADSLKGTIMSFAGLKGVELPDGFIPKAKSLIENMRMRLEKSQQFAQQIAILQAMNLDTQALKDIIESGPIKGAQLAASIIGGGAMAVAEINDLTKKISFTGAALGQMGSDAAFSDKIKNAQTKLGALTDEDMKIRGLQGNNIVIEQGAFVVNVNTSGVTNEDEKADLITRRIQETFAILAKELANK